MLDLRPLMSYLSHSARSKVSELFPSPPYIVSARATRREDHKLPENKCALDKVNAARAVEQDLIAFAL